MSEVLGIVVLFLAALNENKTPKFLIEILSIVASLALWWSYYPGVAFYPGVVLTLFVGAIYFSSGYESIKLKYLPLLTLLSTAPVTVLPVLVALVLILNNALRSTYTRLVMTLLIIVSFLSVGQQVNQTQLSLVMLIMGLLLSISHFWKRAISAGTLWIIVACRFSVFVPEVMRESVLWIMILPLLVVGLSIWSDDSKNSIWANVERLGGVAIIGGAMTFGEFGLWGMLLSWLTLEACLDLPEHNSESDSLKVPWPTAAALFLIPVGPTMLYLSSGKSGTQLFITCSLSLLISFSLWRWIKFAEKKSTDLAIDRNKLIALFFYITAIIVGCIFNLKSPLTALFITLGISTLIIVLFTVLGFDDKVLSIKERSSFRLRISSFFGDRPQTHEDKMQVHAVASGWELLANMGKSITLVLTDIESLIHRTLALSVLALVILLMMLGGINA